MAPRPLPSDVYEKVFEFLSEDKRLISKSGTHYNAFEQRVYRRIKDKNYSVEEKFIPVTGETKRVVVSRD